MMTRNKRGVSSVKVRIGPVRSISVSKESAAFKRATELYVKKATASAKEANLVLVRIGTHDAKGNLKKPYR